MIYIRRSERGSKIYALAEVNEMKYRHPAFVLYQKTFSLLPLLIMQLEARLYQSFHSFRRVECKYLNDVRHSKASENHYSIRVITNNEKQWNVFHKLRSKKRFKTKAS